MSALLASRPMEKAARKESRRDPRLLGPRRDCPRRLSRQRHDFDRFLRRAPNWAAFVCEEVGHRRAAALATRVG
jgi:hypothetical protein